MREVSTDEPCGLGKMGEDSRRVMCVVGGRCGEVRRARVVERPKIPAPMISMWLGGIGV